MEEKINQILINQGRMEEKLDNAIKIQDDHSKDIKALNKFRWGIIGTAFFSSLAVLKAWFGVNS